MLGLPWPISHSPEASYRQAGHAALGWTRAQRLEGRQPHRKPGSGGGGPWQAPEQRASQRTTRVQGPSPNPLARHKPVSKLTAHPDPVQEE